jgi:hypothetical protein
MGVCGGGNELCDSITIISFWNIWTTRVQHRAETYSLCCCQLPVQSQQRNMSRPRWRHATEDMLQVVFSMDPLRGYTTRPTDRSIEFSSVGESSAVEYSGVKRVGWWAVRGLLQFGLCELLLCDAGSWGTWIVREPRVREMFAVGGRYQAMTGEDTADWRLIACCSEL